MTDPHENVVLLPTLFWPAWKKVDTAVYGVEDGGRQWSRLQVQCSQSGGLRSLTDHIILLRMFRRNSGSSIFPKVARTPSPKAR